MRFIQIFPRKINRCPEHKYIWVEPVQYKILYVAPFRDNSSSKIVYQYCFITTVTISRRSNITPNLKTTFYYKIKNFLKIQIMNLNF